MGLLTIVKICCYYFLLSEKKIFGFYQVKKTIVNGTGPLKPNVATKNPQMGDHNQKKGLGEGFNLIHVATIFL